MRSTKFLKICSSSLCLHHMVILRTRNKITDVLMILAWASPFNCWDQTISKWPFNGHFKFCNIYLTQERQNDWTMNIKQNGMSHTRITHDKFHTKKSKMAASRPFVLFFYLFFYCYLGNLA